MGVPGSASFGPALFDGLDLGSAAPLQNYALAFQAGKWLFLSGLDSPSPSVSPLPGLGSEADDIVWSADGSLAMLYSRLGNWVQTVVGLPSAPTKGVYLDISSLGGTLSTVASNSQGRQIAVATEGSTGGVYLSSDSQSFVPVIPWSQVVALSFSADGKTLFVLDRSQPQLAAVNLTTLSFQTLPLDGLAEPLSIRAAQDSQGRSLVYVASGRDKTLRIIDPATRQVLNDVPLSIPPTEIKSFGRSSFLLATRSRGNEPLWLFSSTPQPAVYFVPAIDAPVVCRHIGCTISRHPAGGLR